MSSSALMGKLSKLDTGSSKKRSEIVHPCIEKANRPSVFEEEYNNFDETFCQAKVADSKQHTCSLQVLLGRFSLKAQKCNALIS